MLCVNERQCICLHNLDAGKCLLFKELGCSILQSKLSCAKVRMPHLYGPIGRNRYQAVAIGHVNRSPPAAEKERTPIFHLLCLTVWAVWCYVYNCQQLSNLLKPVEAHILNVSCRSLHQQTSGAWSSDHADICPLYRHGAFFVVSLCRDSPWKVVWRYR